MLAGLGLVVAVDEVLQSHGRPNDLLLPHLHAPAEPVMRRFIDALLALPGDTPRRVVYQNCKFIDLFVDDPRFEVEQLDLPTFRSALIRVR